MCFPDFPFDTQLPSFPHHSDVLRYLHQYTDRYNLHQFIKFNCSVELVTPFHSSCSARAHSSKENGCCVCGSCGDNLREKACRQSGGMVKWTVNVLNLKTGERTSEVFDYVLLCSGYVPLAYLYVQCTCVMFCSHCWPYNHHLSPLK